MLPLFVMKFAAIVGVLSWLLAGVSADPPPDPPSPQVARYPRVFCFRITDIRADPTDPEQDKFFFEFEVLNWSNAHAGGVEVAMTKDSWDSLKFVSESTFSGIDSDGRPLIPVDVNGDGPIDLLDMEDGNGNGLLDPGEDINGNERLDNDPIPGNLPTSNTMVLQSVTESKTTWTLTTEPIQFLNLDGANLAGEAISPATPAALADQCIPSATSIDSSGNVDPLEAVDDGHNVLDGFVMTIDSFSVNKTAHINWFLTGAGAAEPSTPPPGGMYHSECLSGTSVPLGAAIGTGLSGNPYGFGMFSITRVDDFFPYPEGGTWSSGNRTQSGVTQSTRDFFDSVFKVPDPANSSVKFAEFAAEFSPAFTGRFRNDDDNTVNAPVNAQCNGNCGGDPHFKTWSGKRYNYHGECDLVLVHAPAFQGGKGLDVHIRTRIESIYSIISAVSIKSGDFVFEFNHEQVGKPKFSANREEVPDLPHAEGDVIVTTRLVHNEDYNKNVQIIKIDLGSESSIHIHVMDQWVFVDMFIPGLDLLGSMGLLGSYPGGVMLGRDGITDLGHERNTFGSQWQVQEDEPKLFQWIPEGHPQAPNDVCKLPTLDGHQYLRNQNSEMYNEAMDACKKEGISGQDMEDCIFDVAVMNNRNIAAAWWGKTIDAK